MLKILKCICKKIYLRMKFRGRKIALCSGCNIGIHSYFEGFNEIGEKTDFEGYIGRGSYIGKNCWINAKIGRYCSISDNVRVVQGKHPTDEFVSTSPSFYSPNKRASRLSYVDQMLFDEISFADGENKYTVCIGNDVWIGEGVSILAGVSIGDGAILAASAVVVKDVLPYTIVGGVPAKQIRKRFSEDIINEMMKIKWWDWTTDTIAERASDFSNVEEFVTKYHD